MAPIYSHTRRMFEHKVMCTAVGAGVGRLTFSSITFDDVERNVAAALVACRCMLPEVQSLEV